MFVALKRLWNSTRPARRPERRAALRLEHLETRETPAAAVSVNEAFVREAYADLFHDKIGAEALTVWTSMLDQGQSRRDIVLKMENGEAQKFYSIEAARLYEQFLHEQAGPRRIEVPAAVLTKVVGTRSR